MRALVVSDLHANPEALRASLAHVRRKKFDTVICLGDFVGYGAQPNQIVDTMRTFRSARIYIRGNHDRVASGLDDAYGFNHAARSAALWTRDHLTPVNLRFLRELAVGPVEIGNLLLCHGSPYDEDEYVFHEHHAAQVLQHYDARFILYGHTHLPAIFSIDVSGRVRRERFEEGVPFRFLTERRYLVNPGSVGQPRDRDPRASFAIFDTDRATIQLFRAEYDVEKTQAAIRKAGLPKVLADRLAVGS